MPTQPDTVSDVVVIPATDRKRAALALALLVPAPSIGALMAMVVIPGPIGQAILVLSKVWLVALPLVWYRFVERGAWSWSPPRRGGFGVALLSGLAILGIIFAAYFIIGRQWIDAPHVAEMARQNGIGTPVVYIAATFYWIVINSLIEEYVWRWFVVRQCEALMRPVPAIILSALFFTIHHVVALRAQFDWRITILAAVGVFVGGVTWSGLYVRYRSIWPCYVSHILADMPIFVIGWWLIFEK